MNKKKFAISFLYCLNDTWTNNRKEKKKVYKA
jgi:putative flippase GtrA